MKPKVIEIKCEGSTALPYTALKPFQGNLKDLSKKSYQKLKKQLLDLGFSEPISVWEKDGYNILNGHQRLRAIKQMVEQEGYMVDDLPVNMVQAKDAKEAYRKVLSLTSQYGEMQIEGLEAVATAAELDWSEVLENFRFPDLDLNFLAETEENKKGKDEENKQEFCPHCGGEI